MISNFIISVITKIFSRFESKYEKFLKDKYHLDSSIKLYHPFSTTLSYNVLLGEDTYINSGRFLTGKKSKIIIGKSCAIGHNVTISSITHDIEYPTGPTIKHKEEDVIIGNQVWIGSNVFIMQGVTIGDKSIIGANSVVTKNWVAGSIIGGVPARLLKQREL